MLDSDTSSTGDEPTTAPPPAPILVQVTLSRAAELARAGHLDEAEALLSQVTRGPNATPSALDLLARIRAQQGQLLEAQSLWTRAAQLDPSNGAYQAGLRRIARAQTRPLSLPPLWPLLATAAVVLAMVFVALSLQRSIDDLGVESERQTNALATELDDQAQNIAALTSDIQQLMASTANQNDALAAEFSRQLDALTVLEGKSDIQISGLAEELSRQQEALAVLQGKSDELRTDMAGNQASLVDELARQRATIDALRTDVDRLSAAIDALAGNSRASDAP